MQTVNIRKVNIEMEKEDLRKALINYINNLYETEFDPNDIIEFSFFKDSGDKVSGITFTIKGNLPE